MKTLDNLKEAISKFYEVEVECLKIMRDADEEYGLSIDQYDEILKAKFGGEWENTGGGCIVTYIPVNEEYYICLNQESIGLLRALNPGKDMLDWANCAEDQVNGCGDNEVKTDFLYKE